MDLTTMLVIVMFATILTLGMANTLMAIARLINKKEDDDHYWVNTSWLIWLFIMHLNMYWYSSHISQVENWGFAGFLHIIAGPVLIFFATSIFLSKAPGASESTESVYFKVYRRFFLFFALLQIWIISTDFTLESGLTGSGVFNAILVLVALGLAVSSNKLLHKSGAVAAWLLLLIPMLLRGMGYIT